MADLEKLANDFEKYLRLQSPPLALRMLRAGEAAPEKCRQPFRHLKTKVTICQGFSMARKYGWTVRMGAEDMACPPGAALFGFFQNTDYFDAGHMAVPTYAPDLDAGKALEQEFPRFDYNEYEAILVAPMNRADFEPHMLVFYAQPAQIMRLIHGAVYESGGGLESWTQCRFGCSSVISVLKSGKCSFNVPGNGDRVFAGVQDTEMSFYLPMARAEGVAAGLEANHQGGTRYPVPAYLMYQPNFPKNYARQMEIWRELEEIQE